MKSWRIEALDEAGRAVVTVEHGVGAERGLQAGHQKRGGNSFAADVGESDAEARGAEANEIVVVAADGAGGPTDRRKLQAGQLRQSAGEQLFLDFASDGELVFKALALALFGDELGDGCGHFVERFAERAELIVLVDADAMREITATDAEGGVVEIADSARDGARENDAGGERENFEHEENHAGEDEQAGKNRPDRPNGREEPVIDSRGTKRERCQNRCGRGVGTGLVVERFERGCAVYANVEKIRGRNESAFETENFLAGNVDAALNLERNSAARLFRGWLQQHHLNGSEFGGETIEKRGM